MPTKIGVSSVISKIPCALNLYHSSYHMYLVVFYPHCGVVSSLVVRNVVVNKLTAGLAVVVNILPNIWKQLVTLEVNNCS